MADEDSLFGSPPPSPTRGRSPSLALPHSSGTQNVGTIALPGSHIYSELPVNPLASSWHHALELAARPPAQPQHITSPPIQQLPQPRDPPIETPLASQKKRKNKPKVSQTQSVTPPINLPDPAVPPPANFLRNQQNLLGTAGLVGGVRPATLAFQRQPCGSTLANPIVVEDEYDPPPLGHGTLSTRVDPVSLPPPSNEQIIGSLIKQKNIFPVLESLLKLVAAGDSQNFAHTPTHTDFNRRDGSEGRPPKRRKLKSVPAGAVDWDVPYPFPNGEGPQAYRTNWEKERGKLLIKQLTGILKSAAKKAATKTYVRQKKREMEMALSPETHGPPPSSMEADSRVPEVLTDSSNENITWPSSYDTEAAYSELSNSLEQFLARPSNDALSSTEPSDISLGLPASDQDSWGMAMWDAISSLQAQGESESQGSRDSSTHPSPFPSPPSVEYTANPSDSDIAIDPTFLTMLDGQLQSYGADVCPPTPALMQSPMESTSSLVDPSSPQMGTPFPDPEICRNEQGTQGGNLYDDFVSQMSQIADSVVMENSLLDVDRMFSIESVTASKPSPAVQPLIPSHPLTSIGIRSSYLQHQNHVSTGPKRMRGAGAREDILRRAKERRRQLVADIERTRVELWETTMEQGVLMQMVKEHS